MILHLGVLNFETRVIKPSVLLEERMQAQGRKEGKTCLMGKAPLLLHMIVTHSMPPAPPPPSVVSLAFLYSDVVFLPNLTQPVLLKDIKESENIASLHNQIASCDTILEVM